MLVDFTRPDTALDNVRAAVAAGVHAVVGTSGWDVEAVREFGPHPPANVFFAPNFAIGAVLMMRFAAEASHHMARAEIIELHHDRKLDAPSGTAARTAELMDGEVPIHAVMGGLHLGGVMERIIPDTVAALRSFNISHIITGHCTGWRALHALASEFGEAVSQSAVGTTYTFAASEIRA